MTGYLDDFKKKSLPGLKCIQENNIYKFSGNCFSYLSDLLSAEYYNTCSGYVEGFLTGQSESLSNNVICTGNIKGKITNLKNSQQIRVSGILTGILNFNSNDSSFYRLQSITGNIVNTNYGEDKANRHITNLQQTHILGRQILADKNPLMGKQLNVMPSAINRVLLLESQSWDIIEYQVIDYNFAGSNSLLQENKIKLATPTYINSMSRKFSLKSSIPQEKNLFDADQNATNEYFAFILHNRIEILLNANISYYNEDELKNFIGPIKSYEQLINILNQYANINNADLYQINDYQFELITKL